MNRISLGKSEMEIRAILSSRFHPDAAALKSDYFYSIVIVFHFRIHMITTQIDRQKAIDFQGIVMWHYSTFHV